MQAHGKSQSALGLARGEDLAEESLDAQDAAEEISVIKLDTRLALESPLERDDKLDETSAWLVQGEHTEMLLHDLSVAINAVAVHVDFEDWKSAVLDELLEGVWVEVVLCDTHIVDFAFIKQEPGLGQQVSVSICSVCVVVYDWDGDDHFFLG